MILIALGSNLPSVHGDPQATLLAALLRLEALGVRVVAASRIWHSAPVPLSDQPWYHNAVASVETALGPEELMAALHALEAEFGRVRSAVKNEARILDLDLLNYNDVVSAGGLELPHPRLQERAFVLYPLSDIAGDWTHPRLNLSVQEMVEQLPAGQSIQPLGKVAA